MWQKKITLSSYKKIPGIEIFLGKGIRIFQNFPICLQYGMGGFYGSDWIYFTCQTKLRILYNFAIDFFLYVVPFSRQEFYLHCNVPHRFTISRYLILPVKEYRNKSTYLIERKTSFDLFMTFSSKKNPKFIMLKEI